jgi:hypothetical protein
MTKPRRAPRLDDPPLPMAPGEREVAVREIQHAATVARHRAAELRTAGDPAADALITLAHEIDQRARLLASS